jgi:hypothetical protein
VLFQVEKFSTFKFGRQLPGCVFLFSHIICTANFVQNNHNCRNCIKYSTGKYIMLRVVMKNRRAHYYARRNQKPKIENIFFPPRRLRHSALSFTKFKTGVAPAWAGFLCAIDVCLP